MGLYIILMGVQGAGKGMQAGFISDTYNIPHISTGDLFRAMFGRTDDFAQEVKAILKAGDLVSDEITNKMVEERLAEPDAANGVILDGYPRSENQVEFLENLLAQKGEQVNAVLVLDLDLYIAFKRAFGRVTDPETGDSYNYYYKPGDVEWSKEDHPDEAYPPRIVGKLNGKELKRRNDDADADAVINRIETYLAETMPLVEMFKGKGIVHEIDANQDIDEVSKDIKALLDSVKSAVK